MSLGATSAVLGVLFAQMQSDTEARPRLLDD